MPRSFKKLTWEFSMYFYFLAVAFVVFIQKDADAAEMLDEAMLLSSAGGGEDFEFVENSV